MNKRASDKKSTAMWRPNTKRTRPHCDRAALSQGVTVRNDSESGGAAAARLLVEGLLASPGLLGVQLDGMLHGRNFHTRVSGPFL